MNSAHSTLTNKGLTAPSRKLAPHRSKCSIAGGKAPRRSSGTSLAHTTTTMTDWARIRADTPAAEKVLHLNNAGAYACACAAIAIAGDATSLECLSGSALPTKQVVQAQHDYLQLEANIGG